MTPLSIFSVLISLTTLWSLSSIAGAKVFMVLMDDDAVVSYKTNPNHNMTDVDFKAYKEKVTTGHDSLLEALLPVGSYTKLYSYTHLLNGFALHASSDEAIKILRQAGEVRAIHEDVKLEKLTTHTPEYLGIPNSVWPQLGGGPSAGDGVVIGIVDTGIDPNHPMFANQRAEAEFNNSRFRGKCEFGNGFPNNSCNGKIVGARHFARAAIAEGSFNATRHYASPFDADGHGSHAASIAAGNHQTPVLIDGFSYGNASGMAPGARIAVYKAMYSFGGFMSDAVAAVDQAAEDGVDILSLSFRQYGVLPGPASFLSILEMELLMAVKAGIFVAQAIGNGGPSSSSLISFSPWIVSVAASTVDRKYNNSIVLENGQSFSGTGLSPPTARSVPVPMAAAADVSVRNKTILSASDCRSPELFVPAIARRKLIICTYTYDDISPQTSDFKRISETIRTIGAAGFIISVDPGSTSDHFKRTTLALSVPGILLNDLQSSKALWDYYNSNTFRSPDGTIHFRARARILDGRRVIYTGRGPMVASYSSRGPDVNNVELETADVLKPNVMAPGSSIWAAWSSPVSEGGRYIKGRSFALLSGTSMATPHIAGIAALIKQKHPSWSPAAIASAMMTTADVTDRSGAPILAQGGANNFSKATPFDYGAGFINPAGALDPGLVFDVEFKHYVQFLCAVPGVDEESVRTALGIGCPSRRMEWSSDLNTPSITVANLVGSRKVVRRVTNVGNEKETYQVIVREPAGVVARVEPRMFSISPNASRVVNFFLEAEETSGLFSFGEVLFVGDRKHEVRVPMAVYVTSAL